MTQEELRQYFTDECTTAGESVIKLGQRQLCREDYMTVKKTLESRGGKWKGGSVQGFVFMNGNAPDVLASLQNGETGNAKKKYQLFETPDSLADRLVSKVGKFSAACYVLEPSAGNGRLIEAIHRVCPDVEVEAYEINPDCWGALERLPNVLLHKGDFLQSPDDASYRIIIANPPFTKNQDVRHFYKMWTVLAVGGRMSVIMSQHWMTAKDKTCTAFRSFLDAVGAQTEEIEVGAFRTSGTDVPTVIVTAEKTRDNEYYYG